jgi:SAM-dependent methyltransferase
MKICCICGGTEFNKGPMGRTSVNGNNPKCDNCGSLERHRIIYDIYKRFPENYFSGLSLLQFSIDNSVNRNWFKNSTLSVFGGENSIDLSKNVDNMKSYDVVVCNHVLEHIENDRKAVKNLMTLVNDDGFCQITVPTPAYKKKTEEYGFANEKYSYHYRCYGEDFVDLLKDIPGVFVLDVHAIDNITGTKDYVYFVFKKKSVFEKLAPLLKKQC